MIDWVTIGILTVYVLGVPICWAIIIDHHDKKFMKKEN